MPNCDIYYFSATGNSLAAARGLAHRLDGRALPLAASLRARRTAGPRSSENKSGRILGLVFPVYYASLGASGIPALVRRFLEGPEVAAADYVFAVCTHGGNPGSTLRNLRAALRARGKDLGASLDLEMSVPYGIVSKLSHALFNVPLPAIGVREGERERELLARLPERLDALAELIGKRIVHAEGDLAPLPGPLGSAFLALQSRAMIGRYRGLSGLETREVERLVEAADRGFRLSEACEGCGTCVRVCPVGNIELQEGKPTWRHACETCYACYQWCPRGAIGGPLVEFERRRHHPGIGLGDLLAQAAGSPTSERAGF